LDIAINTRLLLAHRMEGVARYIYETTKQMVITHPEVQFHFLFDRPYDEQFIFADNVFPHVVGLPSRHPLLWYLWFEKSLPAFFKKNKIDAFYSGDMYMSLSSEVPTLMVSHDLNYVHYPEGLKWTVLKYYQHYMPKYHHAADHLITVSEATKVDVVDKYNVDSNKITVAHNAVPDYFAILPDKDVETIRTEITEGNPYFVYIGSLHPRKNVESILLAYDKYMSEYSGTHHLVIYGRKAWKTDKIYQIYEQMKHKTRVHFLSNDDIDVAKAMGAASALCYISLFEGFGIPILEAMACDVPVITSDISSMPEVGGDAVLLVNPKDISAVANNMHRLSTDDKLRHNLIEKGRLQLQKFSWKLSADKIYEQLMMLAIS